MTFYPRWRPDFAAAIDPRFFDIDYLDWLVRTGRAFFLGTELGAIVVELKDFPKCRAVSGLVAAGELGEIRRLIGLAEAWGRSQGCAFAMIESRPGWARALKNQGYETHQVSIVKEL